MISVEEARARILAGLAPVAAETVSLPEALGRVTAEPLIARRTQPPMDVSAMDGFAVRSEDVAAAPIRLSIVAEIAAGSGHDGEITSGTCARIFTGAPVPHGADAIVIQENTTPDGDDGVLINEGATAGTYVRRAGLDFEAGETLIPAGRPLSARHIGLAAAMNVPWISVRRRPRVAILSTGDEIVLPGDPIGPNQIVSSNGPALAAAVTAAGGAPTLLAIAEDDPDALRSIADGATGHDLLLTTGGASVGKHDLVGSALASSGLTLDFWKIAMRPGKPLMFGSLAGVPMLGLPGNPVSALVCFLLFGLPAVKALQGRADTDPVTEAAVLDAPLPENDRREDYLRAKLSTDSRGTTRATPFPKQDSSMMRRLAEADALIRRAPHAPAVKPGEYVDIIRFFEGPAGY
jgi:molybdopterin molybdotransferase